MAKRKEEKTNVMRILDQRKIPYTAHFYEETQGPEGTREYGLHVAEALGQDPRRGFKTLAARGASGGIYVFEVPAPESLDLKKAARAVGEKSVELLRVAEINEVTGYIRGGCSPVGMKIPRCSTRRRWRMRPFTSPVERSGRRWRLRPRRYWSCWGRPHRTSRPSESARWRPTAKASRDHCI